MSGVKILDLSRVLAGPYATMALGELGAEVIKVERPEVGDETRQWGPPFVAGESAYFLSVNRNKRSFAANLADHQGRLDIRTLAVSWADVVVENFRPGSLERFGLGLDAMREDNPRLITATVRGYPQGDDEPGYDFVIQAGSGLMSLTGPVDGEPQKVGVAVSDITTGLYLVSGILAALYERERSGRGQHVSVSLWASQMSWLTNVAESYLVTGRAPSRHGNAHAQLAPYQTFRTQDGPLAIGVGNDGQFRALARSLGHPEWADDDDYATNPARVSHRSALADAMESVLITKPREAWQSELQKVGVPVGPVRTVPEAFAWSREQGHDLVRMVDHATIGPLAQVALPWNFSRTPEAMVSSPPTLGQHQEDIRHLIDGLTSKPSGKEHDA